MYKETFVLFYLSTSLLAVDKPILQDNHLKNIFFSIPIFCFSNTSFKRYIIAVYIRHNCYFQATSSILYILVNLIQQSVLTHPCLRFPRIQMNCIALLPPGSPAHKTTSSIPHLRRDMFL